MTETTWSLFDSPIILAIPRTRILNHGAARQAEYLQGAIDDAQARRLARVAAGVPEGLG